MRWRDYKIHNGLYGVAAPHLMPPWPGAFGRGRAPVPQTLFGGEDCLSEASSAALEIGTGAKAPPWGHARAPMVLGPFAETKGPRRAGAKPRMMGTRFCLSQWSRRKIAP